MNRRKAADLLLKPLDMALGSAVSLATRADALDGFSSAAYRSISSVLRKQLELTNELRIEGEHNVPPEGGVIIASNHQSWLDPQVLAASCRRRVCFAADSALREHPVVRHLADLSQSVFIDQGADDEGAADAAACLGDGKALIIFPEGAIPGDTAAPRHSVDPETGLLPGHAHAVRLAIDSKVPIIPVGISGTGRVLPPEIYPRLELLRPPTSDPIRVRFGRPMLLSSYHGKPMTEERLQELTRELMENISSLVDHRRNYVPIEVPLPDVPRHPSIGVLLLHGFTSSTDTVDGLLPHLDEAGIPYERPILRGHGTRYQDLRGITARDWYNDAERALLSLHERTDKVVVVGLSMGGLVTLDLAARHPDKIAGIVTVAAALRFKDPLTALTPLLAKMVRYWPSPPSFHDPELAERCTNYEKFPTDAFQSLYEYSKKVEERLPDIHVPTLVLAARKDQVIAPEAALTIYERIGSLVREIEWFEQSGHEMMQDLEAEAVLERIMSFVKRFEAPTSKGVKGS